MGNFFLLSFLYLPAFFTFFYREYIILLQLRGVLQREAVLFCVDKGKGIESLFLLFPLLKCFRG
jgi:hypothetical protein